MQALTSQKYEGIIFDLFYTMYLLVWREGATGSLIEAEGSDTEEAEVRLKRRVKEHKCIEAATCKCDETGVHFSWEAGALKTKAGGKVNIRRAGDEVAWKHDLHVVGAEGKHLDIQLGNQFRG